MDEQPNEVDLVTPSPRHPVTPSSSGGPTNAQYFLGLFVLGQLAFLVLANVINLAIDVQKNPEYLPAALRPPDWQSEKTSRLPDWFQKKGHLNDAMQTVRELTKRWEEVTGQPQNWCLFAPNIGRYNTFVAVELRWEDDPRDEAAGPLLMPYQSELLLSDNEPEDPNDYFRWGKFRLRKYESMLDPYLHFRGSHEPLSVAAERWQRYISAKVGKEWDTIWAYLRWRTRRFMARHPDRPMPRQVILLVRNYTIPEPGRYKPWGPPHTIPVARWRPDVKLNRDYYPVERYNPMTVNTDALSVLCYWPQPACPTNYALAGIYMNRLLTGRWEKVSR
jgi:hypothetical protein